VVKMYTITSATRVTLIDIRQYKHEINKRSIIEKLDYFNILLYTICNRHIGGQRMCDTKNLGCPSGRTPRFLQPCILLLLHQKSSYGYELIEDLKTGGFLETNPDPGIVYRILKKFEKKGFVESNWIENKKGPDKKVYKITLGGESLLNEWAKSIYSKVTSLKRFLLEYEKLKGR